MVVSPFKAAFQRALLSGPDADAVRGPDAGAVRGPDAGAVRGPDSCVSSVQDVKSERRRRVRADCL